MGTDAGTAGSHCGENMRYLGRLVGQPRAWQARDIIAVDRDPLADIAALREVIFVTNDGKLHRNQRG